MAKNHPVHSGIAGVLRHIMKIMEKSTKEITLKLSPECDGCHNLPLYIKSPVENETKSENEMCNVDAMILKNNDINIIIEIEESGFIPTKICGKYLTSNLAKLYQYKTIETIPTKESNILFIQIVDIQYQGQTKKSQFSHIETAINKLLETANDDGFEIGCIKRYKIIQIDGKSINGLNPNNDGEDEKEYDKKEYDELRKIIEDELKL
jgi:hypothetical protein